jgi:hypothetical protein
MANVAKYFSPLHNLSVFNPAEFPDQDPNAISVKGLTTITAEVATNSATVDENTLLINSYGKLYSTTIPTATFVSGTTQSIAYTGGTVPRGVPFILIVNINLGTTDPGYPLYSCVCSLANTATTTATSSWNTGTDSLQTTRASPQFVFTGKGNGSPFTLSFNATGVIPVGGTATLTVNTANTAQGYKNDVMMYWL